LTQIRSDIFYLRTTSKGGHFQRNPYSSYIAIPMETYDFFDVETFISCDQLSSRPRSDFEELANKGRISYKGRLSPEHSAMLNEKLKASKTLSAAEKAYVLGPLAATTATS
jgi:predicted ATP-grasp superfamily ATP-dependent carboligase